MSKEKKTAVVTIVVLLGAFAVVLGQKNGWQSFIPKMEYCTDNAAMIAIAGYFKFLKGDFAEQNIAPLARMPF